MLWGRGGDVSQGLRVGEGVCNLEGTYQDVPQELLELVLQVHTLGGGC